MRYGPGWPRVSSSIFRSAIPPSGADLLDLYADTASMSSNAAGRRAIPISTARTCAPRWRGRFRGDPARGLARGARRGSPGEAAKRAADDLCASAPSGARDPTILLRRRRASSPSPRPATSPRRRWRRSARRSGAAVCAFLPLPLSEDDIAAARARRRLCDAAGGAGRHGPARVARSRQRRAHRAVARRRGLRRRSFSALAYRTASRRGRRSSSAPTAWSSVSAALRAALQGTAALGGLLKDLRRGLDG